jgi:predicted nucleic acid-binding protein
MTFIDTNIAVYAVDSHDSRKHKIAAKLIDEAVVGDGFRISAQVLFEFANICQKKLGCTAQEVLKLLDGLNLIEVVNQTPQIVARAVEIKSLYCISLQDAMIVAAAEESRCGELLSEDLNDGQIYAGVRVRNPFKDIR